MQTAGAAGCADYLPPDPLGKEQVAQPALLAAAALSDSCQAAEAVSLAVGGGDLTNEGTVGAVVHGAQLRDLGHGLLPLPASKGRHEALQQVQPAEQGHKARLPSAGELQHMLAPLLPQALPTEAPMASRQCQLQREEGSDTKGLPPSAMHHTHSGAVGPYREEQPCPQTQKPKPRPRPRAEGRAAEADAASLCKQPAAPFECKLRPEDECVVCLSAPRSVMLAPCGHKPYCMECAVELCGPNGIHATATGQVCPLCRQEVRATVSRIFN